MSTRWSTLFPERLRVLIDLTGYRQTDLAFKIQVSQAHISGLVHGKTVPSFQTLEGLCNAFGVCPGQLIGVKTIPNRLKKELVDQGKLRRIARAGQSRNIKPRNERMPVEGKDG